LAKIDAEVEDLQHQINNFEKKIGKLEQEKKKAAAAKKFKEASKA
jgi:phage shock protein A